MIFMASLLRCLRWPYCGFSTKRIDQSCIDPDTRGLGWGGEWIPAKSYAAFFTFKASSSKDAQTKKRHLRVTKGLLGFQSSSASPTPNGCFYPLGRAASLELTRLMENAFPGQKISSFLHQRQAVTEGTGQSRHCGASCLEIRSKSPREATAGTLSFRSCTGMGKDLGLQFLTNTGSRLMMQDWLQSQEGSMAAFPRTHGIQSRLGTLSHSLVTSPPHNQQHCWAAAPRTSQKWPSGSQHYGMGRDTDDYKLECRK